MKLLNTRTLQLHQAPPQPPPYATLSYSPAESTAPTPAQRQSACTEARRLGLEWLWLQSLCIDRSSSAAISESINSLFSVFQESAVCLVYLGNVSIEPGQTTSEVAGKLLQKSRWLRRIWTLTELIASKEVVFFDRDWRQFGTKMSLLHELSDATGIDRPVLENAESLSDFSVARRMSWASICSYDRQEDLAYALIGLFGVSMTILYGEGPLAFLRLQDEISRTTDDASLFCWQAEPYAELEYRGLLAHSPAEFSHFASIPPIAPLHIHGDVQLTNAGMVMKDVSVSHSFGSDIVLPLYSEDGTARYGMCLKFWKDRYVKPYLGFTRLEALVSQTVRRICIIRDVDPRTSAKIAMDSPQIKLDQPPARDGAIHGRRQFRAPVQDLGSHAASFAFASSSKPATGRPHRHGTLLNIYKQNCGPLNPVELAESGCRANSPASPNNRADLSGSSPMRSSDTSTIGYYQTPEPEYPPPDDDTYIFDTRPSSTPALDPGHEFALVKTELTDHVIRLLHSQVKHLAKRSKKESSISRKRKRRTAEKNRAYEEVKNCFESDSDAAHVDELSKSTSRTIFACPFYLHDRKRHRGCLKSAAELRDIKAVEKHVWHAHRQPPYCPICHCVFRTALQRDEHIHAGGPGCKKEFRQPIPEGISVAQVEQLAKRPRLRQPKESLWFGVWDIIFPGEDRPRKPFLNSCGQLEAAVCRLNAFWFREGNTIITEFLREKGLRDYGLKDEERNVAALHTFTLHHLTDELLSAVTADHDGMRGRESNQLILALTHSL